MERTPRERHPDWVRGCNGLIGRIKRTCRERDSLKGEEGKIMSKIKNYYWEEISGEKEEEEDGTERENA